MSWPNDIPYDAGRKRFYTVGEDLRRNPSDYDILNAEQIYVQTHPDVDGQRHSITAGAHKIVLPGNSHPSSYGLPTLLAKPKIFVALKNKPLDIYGFHTRRFVSTRAKELLCESDESAFEFAECETLTRGSISADPYWMMGIARLAHDFDEDRSVFETAKGEDGLTGEAYDGPHLSKLYDIHMPHNWPDDHHAFLFRRYMLRMVFDQTLVDAWRVEGFSGAEFLPLQPPAPW